MCVCIYIYMSVYVCVCFVEVIGVLVRHLSKPDNYTTDDMYHLVIILY